MEGSTPMTTRGKESERTAQPGLIGAESRLLTINEVAEMTGLAVGTLYHFVSQQRIPVVRLSKRCIRFRYSDLLDWIQTLTQETR
jgi:excisionase family DNA binding protein